MDSIIGRHRANLAVGAGLAALTLVGLGSWWSAGEIEDDLTERGRAALAAAGITATVDVEGRDAVLTARPADDGRPPAAVDVIRRVHGVRRISWTVAPASDGQPARGPSPSATPTTPTPILTPTGTSTSPPTPSPTAPRTPTPSTEPDLEAWPSPVIGFASEQTALTTTARSQLDAVARRLREAPEVVVVIRGHTDDLGPTAHNRALSLARAEAVAAHLRDAGVAAERLEIRALGSAEPVRPNDTAAGRAANRRVELVYRTGSTQ
ncbi:MAG: OmpA family protein [Kineosporiaceae bacterium]|nr:OmpA family protein [Kineosporiaceae bacterium]